MLLMAPSVFSAWYPWEAPWRQPWIFNVMTAKGRLEQYKEPPLKYAVPRRTWLSQLPTDKELDRDYWIELSGTGVDGTAITLRVADGGPVIVGERKRTGRRLDLVWNQGRASEAAHSLVLDVGAVLDGDDVDLLLWPDKEPAPNEVLVALERISGVPVGLDPMTGKPALPSYSLAARRYQFLGLRTDAFKCETGVAWGYRQTNAPGIPIVSLRSEVWNTVELPFGLALWDLQTRDAESGAILAVRRLTAVKTGKFVEPPKPPMPAD
jgi:hypothetical protein